MDEGREGMPAPIVNATLCPYGKRNSEEEKTRTVGGRARGQEVHRTVVAQEAWGAAARARLAGAAPRAHGHPRARAAEEHLRQSKACLHPHPPV